MASTSIAVLKPPGDDELAKRQREYLDRYYANMELKVYWGKRCGVYHQAARALDEVQERLTNISRFRNA